MGTVTEASGNHGVVGRKRRRQTVEKEDVCTPCISDYELAREERIRENRERMQKLGVLDLSLKLKSLKPSVERVNRRKIDRVQEGTPVSQPGPVRRSQRLQNSTPVSYCEEVAGKKGSLNDNVLLREEGSKPEIYTEEHEKLLGSTERSWKLFVDGYGEGGKRIYNPVRGKTCHQCRQKTLGHRTNCSQCNMVQGQFCGDCLYMRYGEHVLEANENANWICPVCRGICNCSLCRQAKGWPPTGTLYRKISSLGYKSVAHYLIQTRRADANSDKNVDTNGRISSKRSLPFSDIETTMGEDGLSKASSPAMSNENRMEQKMAIKLQNEQTLPASSNHQGGSLISETLERGDASEIRIEEIKNNEDVGVLETSPKSTNKRKVKAASEIANGDGIASRLKRGRRT